MTSQTAPDDKVSRNHLMMAGLVVTMGFLFNFVARGVVDTFMVFMLPLEAEFGWSRSTLTGVYSVYLLTVGLMAPLSGMMLDRWGPRVTYGLGLATMIGAMWAASTTTALWHIYLFIGGFCGVAASALGMVPAAALIGRWFDRNMSLAIAIAYAGFGSGILVIVPLAQAGIDAYGWRDTYRLIALVLIGMTPLLLLPWGRIAEGQGRKPAVDPMAEEPAVAVSRTNGWRIATALRTREFWLLVQVFFFTACGVYSVVVQTVAYLVDQGYPPIEAALTFGASGMLSIFGVVFSGWLCARYGNRFAATLSFVGTFVGVAALLAFSVVASSLLILIYVIAFGVSQGARGPIISTLTARIFAQGAVASIFGAIFMTMSFGSAFGSWMSGFLHDLTGDYRAAFIFSGVSILVACTPFWMSGRLQNPQALPPPTMPSRGAGT
ncbi:MFS transporter [Mesorhizobium sp. CAU 1732]|uniref:MFS transporter n=1 Tax=Mesorhizobium sp. CAU 1732 TaxID=3140358 RepID=UPI0032612864